MKNDISTGRVIEVLLRVLNDGPNLHCTRVDAPWLEAQEKTLQLGYIRQVYGSYTEYTTRDGKFLIWKWELTELGKSMLDKVIAPVSNIVPISDRDLGRVLELKKTMGALHFVPAVSSTYNSRGETVTQTTLKNKLGGNATYGLFDDLEDESDAEFLELITLLLNNLEYLIDLALKNNKVPT